MSREISREDKRDAVFKALSDARRRSILDMLKEKGRTTGEICDRLGALDRCTVMQHLDVLARADLIIVKREGRRRWNYLNPLPIKEIHDRWISGYARSAVDLLVRMKNDMEE